MSLSKPKCFATEEQLEAELTRPSAALLASIGELRGPLLILGAAGKMGPTLALLAKRAAQAAGHALPIRAVSRFSDPGQVEWFARHQIDTIAADLLNRDELARLPDAADILYLVGFKFGTTSNPSRTWAINALAPAHVAERFPNSRMVALSTGNVYPLSAVSGGGSVETDPLTPLGEYANAAVARERIFEYAAERHGVELALLRLNYAVEPRYGVLVDIGQKVLGGEPIDLAMGFVNCIWQGDANDYILRGFALAGSPAAAWNLTGPMWKVRDIAERFGAAFGRTPQFVGTESDTALLNNAARLHARLGAPATPIETVIDWTADWLQRGGRLLRRPTHFQVRDGVF